MLYFYWAVLVWMNWLTFLFPIICFSSLIVSVQFREGNGLCMKEDRRGALGASKHWNIYI